MIRRRICTLALLALLSSACSSESKVGEDGLLAFEEKSPGGFNADPSPSASVKPNAPAAVTKAPAAPSPKPPPKQAPKPPPPKPAAQEPQVALTISINSDTGGKSQFDPSAARIYTGTCVEWRNADSVARSIVADGGEFSSGPIAPGQAYKHCPSAAGKFNYHDGTRPYAVAYLEVLAR